MALSSLVFTAPQWCHCTGRPHLRGGGPCCLLTRVGGAEEAEEALDQLSSGVQGGNGPVRDGAVGKTDSHLQVRGRLLLGLNSEELRRPGGGSWTRCPKSMWEKVRHRPVEVLTHGRGDQQGHRARDRAAAVRLTQARAQGKLARPLRHKRAGGRGPRSRGLEGKRAKLPSGEGAAVPVKGTLRSGTGLSESTWYNLREGRGDLQWVSQVNVAGSGCAPPKRFAEQVRWAVRGEGEADHCADREARFRQEQPKAVTHTVVPGVEIDARTA